MYVCVCVQRVANSVLVFTVIGAAQYIFRLAFMYICMRVVGDTEYWKWIGEKGNIENLSR